MAVAQRGTASNYLQRAPSPSGLADVLDVILDKGLVIDAFVRVSVIGIEVLTIDARIVIASVDTYLRFAEAVNRLDLTETQLSGLPELRKGVSKLSDIGVGDLGDDLLAKVESLLASDGATRGGYRAARFDTAELEERRRERAARRRRRHQRTRT